MVTPQINCLGFTDPGLTLNTSNQQIRYICGKYHMNIYIWIGSNRYGHVWVLVNVPFMRKRMSSFSWPHFKFSHETVPVSESGKLDGPGLGLLRHVEAGCLWNAGRVTFQGTTALQMAAETGQFETADVLIKYKADVNRENNLECRAAPLHIATFMGNSGWIFACWKSGLLPDFQIFGGLASR